MIKYNAKKYFDLCRAVDLAFRAHAGQQRDNGEPYIFHPLQVMCSMNTYEEMIVAVLHDVLEDTNVTTYDIASEFGLEISIPVEHLTRKKDEEYEDFIQRIKKNELARRVKIADINHNLKTIENIKDHRRRKKLYDRYFKAERELRNGLVVKEL